MAKPSESNRSRADRDAKPIIFVVDDEPMLLELATVILEPAGFQVRTFRDAELALQAYESAAPPPVLIITDFAMHTMNGMELIWKCKQFNPRQKILLISGTVDEGVYHDCPVKPDLFLAKPYHAEQLVETVLGLLKT